MNYLNKILNFYSQTKLNSISVPNDIETPFPYAWVHVFKKKYPRLAKIKLPDIKTTTKVNMLLEKRRSTRDFSSEGIYFDSLSNLLQSCRIIDSSIEPERRTYPSGGARFPVEIYVVNFTVQNLAPGIYHYNFDEILLETLWKIDMRDHSTDFASPYVSNPSCAVIFTSVLIRSAIKYGIKAYSHSLIEAGHMAQNMHLVATELGIGCCSIAGFIDDKVSSALDLTNEEIPIYAIAFGNFQ